PKTVPKSESAAVLPMLAVGRRDAVLFLNEPFRKLLGRRPRTLDEVFGPEPLQNGQVRRIRSDDGKVNDCVVVTVPGTAQRREIYALPASIGTISKDTPGPGTADGWQAIEELPVPLMKIGSDGMILSSNREARALLAVDATDGKNFSEVLDGLGRPIRDWIKEVLEDRQGHASQFMRGRSENKDTFVQVSLKASHSIADGPHLIAVINDVTELKTLEAQFVQSQKMHAIGQLAGGVAHDFNNLLTAISGHCDLLLLRHDQADQDYSDLVQIHQNANRAASLVGQLLAFSRKQNLQPSVIDVRDTLSDLTHLLNRLVGEKISLTISHDPDLSPIRADRRQLEQVMMNLVVNARDAMPGGGAINVETRNLVLETEIERDRAFIAAGDYVEVRVIDEGVGIPPERLQKIFEPFFTTKRTGEGTGLGLSTAYGIVKQTGGFIFADSEVGKGTTFTLLFPHHDLPPETTAEKPIIAAMPPSAPDDAVVLLVEDEAPVRAFASRALRLRGYTVLEADCAESALTMLSNPELSVDIFVTDVIMPGKDGPTWVREALTNRPDTKVVFVSGYSEDAFSDGEAKIPNSVFLPKPFSLNDLASTVHGQLH
ncbi:MAG: ATP-binding protein, partial [Pseudomonadota bacterium]